MTLPDSGVAARLEADRRALLDLSLRNPLLNYVPRSRSILVDGESPEQLLRLLVRENKRMSFRPAAETPTNGSNGKPTKAIEASSRTRSTGSRDDSSLATNLTAEELQSRLLAIYYAARTSIEELGVNTLYLTLGMLTWADPDTPQKELKAPLLLIPVEIERSNARDRFRIRHSDEELAVNLSLSERLRTEFGIKMPEWQDGDDFQIETFFDHLEQAIEGQEDWNVDRSRVVLGFFSFGKFLMYRDIAEEAWPEGAKPSQHPILRSLLADGFKEEPPTVDERDDLDSHLTPESSYLVLDADGSQTLAILDVLNGRNLVIQGPPGTGKSQTITNLIAEALARNKSVLFVAEKLAALEVVKHRLDKAGLGDICLELHSHKTSKKALLEDLKRTLELGRPKLGRIDEDFQILGETRQRLNAYCQALKAPIGETEVSPYQAFGELLQLRQQPWIDAPTLAIPNFVGWSRIDMRRRVGLVEELQARLKFVGVPHRHPFWGSRRTLLLPAEVEKLRELVATTLSATTALQDAGDRLVSRMGLPPLVSRADAEALERGARRISKIAQRQAAEVGREEWYTRREDIERLVESGSTLAELHEKYDATLLPDAWQGDLQETRSDLNTYGRKWWSWLSPRYRRANRKVASLCKSSPPAQFDAKLELLDALNTAARSRAEVERLHPLGAQVFGPRWQGERSKWATLAPQAKAIIQLHVDVRSKRLPSGLLEFLARQPDFSQVVPLVENLKRALSSHLDAVQRLVEFLNFDGKTRFQSEIRVEDQPWPVQRDLFQLWSGHVDEMPALVAFNHLAERCRNDGLAEVVAIAEAWPEAIRDLVALFRLHWYEQLLSRAFQERPALAGFDGRGHDHAIGAFQNLDRLYLRHNRARLAEKHWERLPKHTGGGQLAILRREFEKKTRHLPIRQLLGKAGNAVKAIKPVFLMSPLSVATYLAPGQTTFDLVIFDEASQVKPVDALGAILRARQVVVVGDSKQLPPTDFFARMNEDDDAAEETSGDVESILGLFTSQGAPQRMLRWHYRSRHESLIAVSNREFYEDRLLVFPSPDASRGESGLVLRRTPQSQYDRGKSRTNPAEADAIVEAVFAHARKQLTRPPESRLSLGVASFSRAQTEAIRDRLERRRREDSTLEDFFSTNINEPFFVKNLENVQGDERDVIFISVGYGQTAEGELALNFGPLNDEGGERRLNVLITRARFRCEVFTNLTSNDIDLKRTRSLGMRTFKSFLAYAEGLAGTIAPTDEDPSADSFVAVVRSELAKQGIEVRGPLGSTNASLEIAVVNPDAPSQYLLALETDGLPYQEATSARDRDRLRAQVLESLGWHLARIWSTDWVRNPTGEVKRIVSLIEEARVDRTKSAQPEPVAVTDPIEDVSGPETQASEENPQTSVIDRVVTDEGTRKTTALPFYEMTTFGAAIQRPLESMSLDELAALIEQVVRTEGPVHIEEVFRRIAEGSGAKRLGPRVHALLDSAREHAEECGKVRHSGDFLWPSDMDVSILRDRGELPSNARKIEWIAPEELALGIEKVVYDSLGIEAEALPTSVARLLGFSRTSEEIRESVEAVVDSLIESGRLTRTGNQIFLADAAIAEDLTDQVDSIAPTSDPLNPSEG
ncbi:DUF3320 domain-containing protein [Singulisphaera sp. PoT]|uniref:DUF3320 domain-containing protein n=1 Tax=Singulisphaera sp. PoT TaxID=3411797 RepID=UPI003BF531DA